MKRRKLGHTGLTVSEIGFGCGPTAGLMVAGTAERQREAVARALELGIDYFDTAPLYGDTASEANLGRVLAELGARPHLATKVVLHAADFPDIVGAITRSIEGSVERLGRAPITLIQLHNRVGRERAGKAPFGSGALLSVEDVLARGGVAEAFRALRARGLVEFFGCSAYGGEPAAVERLIDSGVFEAIVVNYSAANPSAWRQAAPNGLRPDYRLAGAKAVRTGMGTVGLRVLEGGLLAGGAAPSNAHGAGPDHGALALQGDRFAALAEGQGCSAAELAIRFALSNAELSTVLLGFSEPAQVEEAALFAQRGSLSPTVLSRIDEALREAPCAPVSPRQSAPR